MSELKEMQDDVNLIPLSFSTTKIEGPHFLFEFSYGKVDVHGCFG